GLDSADIRRRFDEGLAVETGDVVPAERVLAQTGSFPGLAKAFKRLDIAEESPALAASAVEFLLEGLHLSKRLNKTPTPAGSRYESNEPST
ncbi:MAG: magnesium chelatase, partial [Actinomycetota bacterium]